MFRDRTLRYHLSVLIALAMTCMHTAAIATSTPNGCSDGTIEERLGCIEGLEFSEINAPQPGLRSFKITFVQPEDHFASDSRKTFKQTLILHHRSFTAPMVLQTSGYKIFSVGLAEITQLLKTNQIQVEHRFFDTSIAENPDWTKLNIEQSAADFHRISVAFHQIYKKAWVNTGASKGGMTSVFHRRFYPNDVDATVAYVAPISYSLDDQRYVDFVDHVGGDKYADCRTRLQTFQRALLNNKAAILPEVGDSYDIIANKEMAFEFDVIEFAFTFWQYGTPTSRTAGCEAIPAADASAKELHAFLNLHASVEDTFSDSMLRVFQPYFYQVANQLGTPSSRLTHLADLMQFADRYAIDPLLNGLVIPEYKNDAMYAVQKWVKEDSHKMMFVYGAIDPWTAGAFETAADASQENITFTVPGGNHGSILSKLPAVELAQAKTMLARWLRVDLDKAKAAPGSTLEESQFKYAANRRVRL